MAKGYSEMDWAPLAQVVAENAGLPAYQADGANTTAADQPSRPHVRRL